MKKRISKLRLSRETLAVLDPTVLAQIAGASDTCESVCIGMCNPSQSCISQCSLCPTRPFPTRNVNC
jgi:hypothetical protein